MIIVINSYEDGGKSSFRWDGTLSEALRAFADAVDRGNPPLTKVEFRKEATPVG